MAYLGRSGEWVEMEGEYTRSSQQNKQVIEQEFGNTNVCSPLIDHPCLFSFSREYARRPRTRSTVSQLSNIRSFFKSIHGNGLVITITIQATQCLANNTTPK